VFQPGPQTGFGSGGRMSAGFSRAVSPVAEGCCRRLLRTARRRVFPRVAKIAAEAKKTRESWG